jgi:hypothetical protein
MVAEMTWPAKDPYPARRPFSSWPFALSSRTTVPVPNCTTEPFGSDRAVIHTSVAISYTEMSMTFTSVAIRYTEVSMTCTSVAVSYTEVSVTYTAVAPCRTGVSIRYTTVSPTYTAV